MLNKGECGTISSALAGADDDAGNEAMRAVATIGVRTRPAAGADDASLLKKLTRQAGEAARLLKMLGNEKRLLILCFLAARGEMTVGELVRVVKLSQSALSQHLGKLRADGLVAFRRDSQTLHYRVADISALRVLQLLKQIYCDDLK
jgi:ArsR family transcriptional regulator, virulence genes transcriptional regulator